MSEVPCTVTVTDTATMSSIPPVTSGRRHVRLEVTACGVGDPHLQGYLARMKPPIPLGPSSEPRHGPTVGSCGVAVSYEQGTPLDPAFTQPPLTGGLGSSRQTTPRQFRQVARALRINPNTITPCSGSFSLSGNVQRAFSIRGTAPASRTDRSFLTEQATAGVPRP